MVVASFCPLSWGLSFNELLRVINNPAGAVKFSSPFLGTFFQLFTTYADNGDVMKVFVPFLGDFLSILR